MLPDQAAELAERATLRSSHPDTPRLVFEEISGIIRRAIINDPRSLQTRIGPSGTGHPCARHIAYTLAEVPPAVPAEVGWRQFVGKAVGAMVEEHMINANDDLSGHAAAVAGLARPELKAAVIEHFAALNQREDWTRWIVQTRVNVGSIGDDYPDITGSLDIYDAATATIIDVKTPGNTAMKKHKPGPRITDGQYRAQVHQYGTGAVRLGLPVDWVGVLRFPAAGEWDQRTFQWERHDPDVAPAVLSRVAAIHGLVKALGPGAAAVLEPTQHFCHRCDFYRPDADDLAEACPGAPGTRAPFNPRERGDAFAEIL